MGSIAAAVVRADTLLKFWRSGNALLPEGSQAVTESYATGNSTVNKRVKKHFGLTGS
jgi:hypothetical protein